jgi:hypothetical protein
VNYQITPKVMNRLRLTDLCFFSKSLEENMAAVTVHLDSAYTNMLDDSLALGKVCGKRFADSIMALVDR